MWWSPPVSSTEFSSGFLMKSLVLCLESSFEVFVFPTYDGCTFVQRKEFSNLLRKESSQQVGIALKRIYSNGRLRQPPPSQEGHCVDLGGLRASEPTGQAAYIWQKIHTLILPCYSDRRMRKLNILLLLLNAELYKWRMLFSILLRTVATRTESILCGPSFEFNSDR